MIFVVCDCLALRRLLREGWQAGGCGAEGQPRPHVHEKSEKRSVL